jgi:hypothetical protein
MLAAIRPENSPQLKVLSRSKRILNIVRLSQDGSRIYFGLVTDSIEFVTVNYELSTTGQLIRYEPYYRSATILGVIDHSLIHYTLVSLLEFAHVVSYDLDKRTRSHGYPAILHVNRRLRASFLEHNIRHAENPRYRTSDQIACKIQMTTQDIRAAFEKFEALGDCMITGLPRDIYDWHNVFWVIGGPTGCYLNYPEITLNYEIEMRLEDVRLEVTELVFRTQIISPETTIRVQRAAYDGIAAEQTISKLFDLRARVVVSLSSLLDTFPARKNDQCPRIWADGLFADTRGRVRFGRWNHSNGHQRRVWRFEAERRR